MLVEEVASVCLVMAKRAEGSFQKGNQIIFLESASTINEIKITHYSLVMSEGDN